MNNEFRKRLNSDRAAVGSVETILLIALALGIVTFVAKTVGRAIKDSAKHAADAIEQTNGGK